MKNGTVPFPKLTDLIGLFVGERRENWEIKNVETYPIPNGFGVYFLIHHSNTYFLIYSVEVCGDTTKISIDNFEECNPDFII